MADGSRAPKLDQHAFHFPKLQAACRLRPGEIVVDLFAGGGGASTAIEHALGRPVDIAVNHNPWAVSLHAANHPYTRHLCQDVWEADPRIECDDRAVGHLHASPDCTHFSQAKGGQPRSRATRSLSWVVLRWAGSVRPRIITLENVRQILQWGPLIAKRDHATGRVVKLDGSIAAPGERVPIDQQFLIPDKRHAGRTWRHFIAALRGLGYAVEWRVLRACDYEAAGLLAGTSRERLFLVARCDGQPIRWPEPTRGPGRAKPYMTAADAIDFTDTGRSIFDRPRPLADATLRRIARGVKRYVLDAAEPFIVGVGGRMGQSPERPVSEPMQTITAKADACLRRPMPTICAKGSIQRLVSAKLEKYDAGNGRDPRRDSAGPLHREAGRVDLAEHGAGSREQCESGHAAPCRDQNAERVSRHQDGCEPEAVLGVCASSGVDGDAGTDSSRPADQSHRREQDEQQPGQLGAGDAVGEHATRVRHGLEGEAGEHADPETAAGQGCREGSPGTGSFVLRHSESVGDLADPGIQGRALQVAAFLATYYGNGQAVSLSDPMDTITTRDRLALVTVHVHGVPYVIVDIHLRMLRPAELFRAQGFPASYIIDRTADGRAVSTSRAVAMVGNSVSPPPLAAILEANFDNAQEALAA